MSDQAPPFGAPGAGQGQPVPYALDSTAAVSAGTDAPYRAAPPSGAPVSPFEPGSASTPHSPTEVGEGQKPRQHSSSAGEGHGAHPHHFKYGQVDVDRFRDDESTDEEEEAAAAAQSQNRENNGNPKHGGHVRRELKTAEERAKEYLRLERHDARRRRIHQERRYWFRRPRALQYFRGSTLVRSEDEHTSHRLELFFDLTFVGLIAVLAKEAVHQHNGNALVRYILTYVAAFVIWNYMREVFNSFFVDDMLQRLLVLITMCCLVIYGNNATEVEAMRDESGARQTTIGTYLVATGCIMAVAMFYTFFVPQYRTQIRAQILVWVCVVGIWIGAIFVSVRVAVALATIALFAEYATWTFFYSPAFKKLMHLQYSSAVSIEHEIERFSDFVTLVHGEFLLSVLLNGPAGPGMHSGVARAVLTVIIAFTLHGMYSNGAGSRTLTHPIRHSGKRAILFFTLHVPFVAAVTLCGDTTAEMTTENEVAQGVRWMFAGSYATALLSCAALAFLEDEHDEPGALFFNKYIRIGPRIIAAIVVVLLPLAEQEHFDSTKMLATAAALNLAAYLIQEIGSLDGPNAEWYRRHREGTLPDKVDRYNEWSKWRGVPQIAEPGAWRLDHRKQRGDLAISQAPTRANTVASAPSGPGAPSPSAGINYPAGSRADLPPPTVDLDDPNGNLSRPVQTGPINDASHMA